MDGRTKRETNRYIKTSLRVLPVHTIRTVSVSFTYYKVDVGKPPAATSEEVFPLSIMWPEGQRNSLLVLRNIMIKLT
jgi:hypothetical protein